MLHSYNLVFVGPVVAATSPFKATGEACYWKSRAGTGPSCCGTFNQDLFNHCWNDCQEGKSRGCRGGSPHRDRK